MERWRAECSRRAQIGLPLALLLCLAGAAVGECAGNPHDWVPARWEGGPLELARQLKDHAAAVSASAREAIANWYDPATLSLLEGTPINCLLVTFSDGTGSQAEEQQRRLAGEYARLARERGIAVLGMVYPGGDASAVAQAASDARLDGVVLDGEFPAGYAGKLETELRSKNSGALVIVIAKDAASVRTAKAPLLAVRGVRPDARDLADMGIRAGPSSEPWIESNIWLVRSFRLETVWRPIWIDQAPNASSAGDAVRCVADAAVAGGRWIAALDDDLRSGLFRKDARALATWQRIAGYLGFAEEHAEWRTFVPYGNLGIILDTAGQKPDISNEYLNLVARRQVPYRIIVRSRLSAAALESFQALLAVGLDPPTDAERTLLLAFAEKGGLVVTGPSWGDPPKNQPYVEVPLGKGRIAVYKEDPPDPEAVARDMLDLLEPEALGVNALNVPSVLTYASAPVAGRRVLVQLLNYAGRPFDQRITIRVNGRFQAARLYTPEEGPIDLAMRTTTNGRTQVTIPRLAVWGAVMLE